MDDIKVEIKLTDLKKLTATVDTKDYYLRMLLDIKKVLNNGKSTDPMNAEILKMLEFVA